MAESPEFQQRVARIEEMVRKLESSADPSLRTTARELVQSLMELHAEGLGRIMESIAAEGEPGLRLVDRLGQDPLVGSLLVLYNLHPDDFETRVNRGLDKARMALRKQGATLQVIMIGQETVRVKITGSNGQDLQSLVRDALYETAPDASEVVVEGGQKAQDGFVPLESLLAVAAAETRP
jgi:hypothetical protein